MNARNLTLSGILTGLALILVTTCTTTIYAGLDVSFGATVQLGDDTEVYLAVSSQYYDQDESNVRKWDRQYKDSDDLAVALFIARHGHESPEHVYDMRRMGVSWWEIGVRLGVPTEAWFVPVKKDPGPPYGKAYGHWKKNGKKSPGQMNLSDADAQNLVAVRMLHEYYGVSVEVAMDWRSSGRDLKDITAGEYRNRHGKSKKGRVADASISPGSHGGKGKSKSKGKK
jgi:hypothetical protein